MELHEKKAALGFWKLRKWAAWLIFSILILHTSTLKMEAAYSSELLEKQPT